MIRRLTKRSQERRERKGKPKAGKRKAPSVFGGLLADAALSEKNVPRIVESCVRALEKHGLETEGLFRIPAGVSRLEELAQVFSKGNVASAREALADATAHEVAGFLKLYLKKLADPVITVEQHKAFLRIGSVVQDGERVAALSAAVKELPPVHRSVLQYLVRFFTKISQFQDINKMTPSNVAIVIGPTLMQPMAEDPAVALEELPSIQRVMTTLVAEYRRVFGVHEEPGHSSHRPSDAGSEADEVLDETFGFGEVFGDDEEQFGFEDLVEEEDFSGFDGFDGL